MMHITKALLVMPWENMDELVRTVQCAHLDLNPTLHTCIKICKQQATPDPENNLKCLESSSYLAFFGFCNADNLGVLMKILEYALQPRLIHVSFVKPGNFEGILSMEAESSREAIEALLACFSMGIGTVEVDGYMQTGMIACLERIAQGTDTRGNIHTEACESVREHISRVTQERTLHMISHLMSPLLFEVILPVRAPYEEPGVAVFLRAGSVLYTPTYILAIHNTPPQDYLPPQPE